MKLIMKIELEFEYKALELNADNLDYFLDVHLLKSKHLEMISRKYGDNFGTVKVLKIYEEKLPKTKNYLDKP